MGKMSAQLEVGDRKWLKRVLNLKLEAENG